MKETEYLMVGQIFEKFGMCKQVVAVTIHRDKPFLDGRVEWRRPGSDVTHAMWLPLWVKWAKTATPKS